MLRGSRRDGRRSCTTPPSEVRDACKVGDDDGLLLTAILPFLCFWKVHLRVQVGGWQLDQKKNLKSQRTFFFSKSETHLFFGTLSMYVHVHAHRISPPRNRTCHFAIRLPLSKGFLVLGFFPQRK